MHIIPRIEKVLIKSKSVLKCWDHRLSDVLVDIFFIKWKILCFVGLKSVSAVGFSGKAYFLESVYFHSQIMGATNFGLALDNSIVITMFFIKNYIVKLSMISFF